MTDQTKALRIEENVPLAPMTTFGIGGAARFFAEAKTEAEVAAALGFAGERGLPVFILGGGSNVLIADSGFSGLVLRVAVRGVSFGEETEGRVAATAGAGEDWDEFVASTVARDLQGVECLSGIPGLVGGTPVQNVGAYGQEVSETIVSVRVLERATGAVTELSNAGCGFGYRESIFNTTMRDRFIVLAVTFSLVPNGRPKIVYKDLKERFGDSRPSLAEVREAVRGIRAEKGMLVRQGGADARSAGSFFKNPIVSEAHFAEITKELPNVPGYPAGGGMIKIPAAWLIEKSGFQKGFTLGEAGLSTVHTLALTNRGAANAASIITLKDEIQKGVRARFGIELRPEPVFVGF